MTATEHVSQRPGLTSTARPGGPARGKFELLSLRKCRQRRTRSSSEFQARANRGLTSGLQQVEKNMLHIHLEPTSEPEPEQDSHFVGTRVVGNADL